MGVRALSAPASVPNPADPAQHGGTEPLRSVPPCCVCAVDQERAVRLWVCAHDTFRNLGIGKR